MFAKPFILILSVTICLAACMPTIQTTIPPVTDISPANETSTPPAVPEQTSTPQFTRTPRATTTLVPLQLQKIETLPGNCSDMDQGLPGEGLSEVAYLPSGYCFHGELDMFETSGRLYVAQVIGSNDPRSAAAFRIVDVTDAEQPLMIGAWEWSISTYTSDVKSFRQGDRWFLAVSRDPFLPETTMESLCSVVGGIAIVEVTEPGQPKLINLLTGESTGSRATKKWCNSHTAEVSRDAEGNGAYL